MTKTLTTDQVAEHFGVNVDSVCDWIKAGKLEAVNISAGKKKPTYRITVRAIRRFERRNSTLPKPAAKRRKRPAPVKQYV